MSYGRVLYRDTRPLNARPGLVVLDRLVTHVSAKLVARNVR
jgi:hypothetical protein